MLTKQMVKNGTPELVTKSVLIITLLVENLMRSQFQCRDGIYFGIAPRWNSVPVAPEAPAKSIFKMGQSPEKLSCDLETFHPNHPDISAVSLSISCHHLSELLAFSLPISMAPFREKVHLELPNSPPMAIQTWHAKEKKTHHECNPLLSQMCLKYFRPFPTELRMLMQSVHTYRFRSWSWPEKLSPPYSGPPHVTTEPSSRIAANAQAVAWICWTPLSWSQTAKLWFAWLGSPSHHLQWQQCIAALSREVAARKSSWGTLQRHSRRVWGRQLHSAFPPGASCQRPLSLPPRLFGRVTTILWTAPCHNWAIFKDRSKCTSCGLNLLDTPQLIADCKAVVRMAWFALSPSAMATMHCSTLSWSRGSQVQLGDFTKTQQTGLGQAAPLCLPARCLVPASTVLAPPSLREGHHHTLDRPTSRLNLNLPDTPQLVLYCNAVATILRTAPSHHGPILQDCSECKPCSLNLPHTLQLTFDCRAVTAKLPIAPCHNYIAPVAPQSKGKFRCCELWLFHNHYELVTIFKSVLRGSKQSVRMRPFGVTSWRKCWPRDSPQSSSPQLWLGQKALRPLRATVTGQASPVLSQRSLLRP